MTATLSPRQLVSAAADRLAGHDAAVHTTVRLLIDRVAEHRGLTPPDWPALATPVPAAALAAARDPLAELDVTGWTGDDLGAAYELLVLPPAARRAGGTYYTPPALTDVTVRLSIGQQLARLAAHPDPGNVLQVLAVDPACGGGAFLVAAGHRIAAAYAERLFGEATELTTAIVLPDVLAQCVFGIDIDPVAVDLAKAALWFEIDGAAPITFMDRNIIVGDPLSGPDVQPPKLAERLAERRDTTTPCLEEEPDVPH